MVSSKVSYKTEATGFIECAVITVPPLRKKLKVTQPTVELWGKVDKTQSIQHLHLSELEGQKVIAAARINGRVTFHSRDDGSMVKELLLYESSRANFVGLHADKEWVLKCCYRHAADFSADALPAMIPEV